MLKSIVKLRALFDEGYKLTYSQYNGKYFIKGQSWEQRQSTDVSAPIAKKLIYERDLTYYPPVQQDGNRNWVGCWK